MTTDLDIFRSAKLLIDQHGRGAILETAIRADQLRAVGDPDGQAVWLRIRAAVLDLLRERPGNPFECDRY